MEHVRHLPRGEGDVPLDGVRERVHAGGGGQALGHGGHHVRIDDGDDGHVVRVHADELALALHVRDDVVDRHLGGGAGGVGTAMIGAQGFFVAAVPSRLRTSANSGLAAMMPMALAVSIEEPPPMAMM